MQSAKQIANTNYAWGRTNSRAYTHMRRAREKSINYVLTNVQYCLIILMGTSGFKGQTQMRLPKRITLQWLDRRGACTAQTDLFASLFPSGLDLTRANLRLAARKGLYVDWLYRHLLSAGKQIDYVIKVDNKYKEWGTRATARKFYMYAATTLADFLGLE